MSPLAEQEYDTLIEVVQIIEKDEPDVQPSQGQEEGEEEQAKPDTVALAGLYLLFRMSPPVAAVQAVEAAGPDGAAAGGLCHGEGLLLSEQASQQLCLPAPLRVVCLLPLAVPGSASLVKQVSLMPPTGRSAGPLGRSGEAL